MRLVRLGQLGLVESKGDRDITDLLVIVEVGYHAGQRVGTIDRLLRAALRLVCSRSSSRSVLRGGIGRRLRLLDTRLSAVIGALDGTVVGCRGVVELVGLLHQRSGLRANVILGGAAGSEQQ